MSSITIDKEIKFELDQKKLDLMKRLNEEISWNEFFSKVEIKLPKGDDYSEN